MKQRRHWRAGCRDRMGRGFGFGGERRAIAQKVTSGATTTTIRAKRETRCAGDRLSAGRKQIVLSTAPPGPTKDDDDGNLHGDIEGRRERMRTRTAHGADAGAGRHAAESATYGA